MNPSRIIASVLAFVCAGLLAVVVTSAMHSRQLNAQLAETEAELDRAKTHPGTSSSDRLRQALEEQALANAALRDELAQLKRGASETNAPAASATMTAPGPAAGGRGNTGGGSAWLERLKQQDPERYKQIVEQREQRRKATDQWFADTINQLDQRAQSAPTEQEANIATQIADTLAKLNDLRQQWDALRALPEAEVAAQGQELVTQMRETQQTLRDLSTQDRTLQLQNYARSLGVTDDNGVQEFVAGVTAIYSNTNYRALIGGGGFGGGGPGSRGVPPPANTSSPATPKP